jgi:deazaflavin-dependent oxidoreductase (nitroreductase family)
MLVHVGRRSGVRGYTVLEVMEYRKGLPEMVALSGFGRNPDWLLNIAATPSLEVVIGSRRFTAILRRGEAVRGTP